MKKDTATATINKTYKAIKEILEEARSTAFRAVNFAMVQAYWNVGRVIVEDEQKGKVKAGYGRQLINELAERLTADFGKGFDPSNLWHMRSFFLAFPILDAVRRELTWTHYRLLLKVERSDVRQFYIDECIAGNWATRQLERQINSFYYERLLSSRKKALVRAEINKLEPKAASHDVIKDPYVLEFLGLKENREYLDTELEQGLMDKLHDFLLELG